MSSKSGGLEMLNIFIAIGGSGTKVAEALVRLLAVGFPTKIINGIPTSAGDELQIWRLDPDRSAGAAQSLQQAVDMYDAMQNSLKKTGVHASQWAMDIDPEVRHLNPLAFSPEHEKENERLTLRGILHSQGKARNGENVLASTPFINLFYEQKDLDVEIDRGFYQKPFIGAPIVSIFAESLKDANSPGGKQCKFTLLETHAVRFFLCGSLYGGTGACGVPVLGKFLGDYKKDKPNLSWQIGGCLLAPYSQPPAPPFEPPPHLDLNNFSETVNQYLNIYNGIEPFKSLPDEQIKRKLVEQILLGFYADPKEMTARARHSLVYYKEHITAYFNALYLIGKQKPDELKTWSNGGASQQNPMNSAEVVAAIAALNFYAGGHDSDSHLKSYVAGSSTRKDLDSGMRLSDLPVYTIAKGFDVDAEKIFLATAALRHLLVHQIPWDASAANFPKELKKLKDYYQSHPENEYADKIEYQQAMRILCSSIYAVLARDLSLGWTYDDFNQIGPLLFDDPATVADLTDKFHHKVMSSEAKGEVVLGQSRLKISTKEFGNIHPEGTEFSRGEFLRHVWNELLKRAYA
jgi:hypothetical protein